MPTAGEQFGNAVDLLADAEITEQTDILRASSEATEPTEMLSSLGRWLRRLRRSDLFMSVSRRGLPAGEYKITRVIDNLDNVEGLNPARSNPWRDWTKIPAHTGGLIGYLIEQDRPQSLLDLNVPDDPVLGIIARDMRSVLAIPNFDGGEALNWGIFFRNSSAGWTRDEISRVLHESNLVGLATKNLVEKTRAQEINQRYNAQLEQVAQVQRALLPARYPTLEGIEIATSYLTSDEAGGDYYDLIKLPDGTLGMLIADVAGHGPAAATVMAMLRAIILCYESDEFTPSRIMEYCNQKLAATMLSGSFTTAFFAILDPATGELTYSRWGHNPPRLLHADGRITELDGASSLPLGIDPDAVGTDETLVIEPEASLIMYTDGITEAFAPPRAHDEREMFGIERMDDAIRSSDGQPKNVIDAIHAALLKHVGSMTRDDDQTLVAVRFKHCAGEP